jgi:hypothetical protein
MDIKEMGYEEWMLMDRVQMWVWVLVMLKLMVHQKVSCVGISSFNLSYIDAKYLRA